MKPKIATAKKPTEHHYLSVSELIDLAKKQVLSERVTNFFQGDNFTITYEYVTEVNPQKNYVRVTFTDNSGN